VVVADDSLRLKDWFFLNRVPMVLLRPDRFVAAAGSTLEVSDTLRRFSEVLCTTPVPVAKVSATSQPGSDRHAG